MHIEIERVSFSYPEAPDRGVLTDFSANMYAGECVGIIGPSGCGKTTLLRLIAGLIVPQFGSIRIAGCTPANVREHVSLMFQDARLLSWLTAADNVALPFKVRGKPPEVNVVHSTLERVGLSECVRSYPSELSIGMRQRVALARALVMRPRVLLLDEPFSALDIVNRRQMQRLLTSILQDKSLACLLVTHDLAEAAQLCDRVLILGTGTPTLHQCVAGRRSTEPAEFAKVVERLQHGIAAAMDVSESAASA